jgi:hypothetical protein
MAVIQEHKSTVNVERAAVSAVKISATGGSSSGSTVSSSSSSSSTSSSSSSSSSRIVAVAASSLERNPNVSQHQHLQGLRLDCLNAAILVAIAGTTRNNVIA